MFPQNLKHVHDKPLVVLDIETTGLYYDAGDEIIELAAERLVNRQVVDNFHVFIRPTRPVPPEATAIHGLTDDYLHAHGEEASAVFPRFADFISDAMLVGHNIRRFDYPFILTHFDRLSLPLPANELLDTLELSRAMLNLYNYKLGTVAAHFSIPTAGAHRAAADVAVTRQIFLNLVKHLVVDG